jgi:signal transduction histidine kinase
MSFKEIFSQHKKYNISFWEYPPFIFFILGVFIIGIILLTYSIGNRYLAPEYVSLVAVVATFVLFILDYLIVNSFQALAEANLVKSEFLHLISHQLRGPLTSSRWVLDLALEEKQPTKLHEYFVAMKEQNQKMIKLISSMLFASRLERGKIQSVIEEVDIAEVLDSVLKSLAYVINGQNIKIQVEKDKNIQKILVDRQKISQVIESFINNAIAYSKGGDTVNIKVKKDKKSTLIFQVADKGIGIPEEHQKYIFKKFFRSSNVYRQQTQGLGLSLFVAKLIIDEFKGKVGFYSKEKEGSVFWFELPLNNN